MEVLLFISYQDSKKDAKLFCIACALSLCCNVHAYMPQPLKERKLLSSFIYSFNDSKQSVRVGDLWQQFPKQ